MMSKKMLLMTVFSIVGLVSTSHIASAAQRNAQQRSQSVEEQRSKCKARCAHEFRQESNDDLADCQKFCDGMYRYEKCIRSKNLENCAADFEQCAQQCRDKECVKACAQKAKSCEMPCRNVFPQEPPQLPGAGKAARASYK